MSMMSITGDSKVVLHSLPSEIEILDTRIGDKMCQLPLVSPPQCSDTMDVPRISDIYVYKRTCFDCCAVGHQQ